jgi:hypothetical protein
MHILIRACLHDKLTNKQIEKPYKAKCYRNVKSYNDARNKFEKEYSDYTFSEYKASEITNGAEEFYKLKDKSNDIDDN